MTKVTDEFMVGYVPPLEYGANATQVIQLSAYLEQFVNAHCDATELGEGDSELEMNVDEPENNKVIVEGTRDAEINGEYIFAGRSETGAGIFKKIGTNFACYECSLDDKDNTRRWYISKTEVSESESESESDSEWVVKKHTEFNRF